MADTKEFQEWAKFMDVIKANTKNPLEVKYDSQMGDFATEKRLWFIRATGVIPCLRTSAISAPKWA